MLLYNIPSESTFKWLEYFIYSIIHVCFFLMFGLYILKSIKFWRKNKKNIYKQEKQQNFTKQWNSFPSYLVFCAILFGEIHGWAMFKKKFFFQSMVVLFYFILYYLKKIYKGNSEKQVKRLVFSSFLCFKKKKNMLRAISYNIYNIISQDMTL